MNSLALGHYEKIESYLPIDLLTFKGFALGFVVVLSFILIRYFLLVGGAYYFYWIARKWKLPGQALHDQKVPPSQIKSEINYSMLSSLVFALSGIIMGVFWQLGISQLYLEFDYIGLWYLPVSFLIYSLVHELYFYFTHVWMHRPKVYRAVHAVHHLSVKTSPWASFSFHPLEAVVHAAFLPIMILFVPIHPVIIIFYLTFMTITAISNHLGVEVIPYKIISGSFISGGHHSKHHRKMNVNFGLYFTFMDKLMGTDVLAVNKKNKIKNKSNTKTKTLEKVYE